MSPSEINITLTVDGQNYNLNGIPRRAMAAFMENTKRHFPESGDDAWAAALTEVILSFSSFEAYFMTDIPEVNAKALEGVFERVGWSFDQFHAYLLHAAIKAGALRLISFHEGDATKQQLGTLVITGIRKSTFDKIEEKVKVPVEQLFGYMFQGFERGEITFIPEDVFVTASRQGQDSDRPTTT